ncbi:indole-3-glycerol phosphate synthase TrpC [Anaerosporobacter mobilis]|uniref:indole-3-glycerol phosphate synthase TrpC n=1 Tax=Anaerosporobacter mobilis TaxID=264463 RepID=UPI000933EC82
MHVNILEEIAEKTKVRVAAQKERISLEEMKQRAIECVKIDSDSDGINKVQHTPFEEAIAKKGLSFICEAKKASPSKGVIAEDFPYLDIAKDYEAAGASAISVLTEPYYFQGDNAFLKEITENVSIPALRKDFTVDEYQIYEAKTIGAGAILLICAILDDDQLRTYREIADSLNMATLVEAHDEEEVKRALETGARIIGVNNRDLKTFQVDIQNSIRLRALVPKEVLFISESGIKTADDIKELVANGVDGVLIGETMMTATNRREQLQELIQSSRR